MELVDTHCHIQSIGAFAGEEHTRKLWAGATNLTPEKVISSAQHAGVSKLICVGCDLEDSKLAIDFVKKRLATWASIGIHPHSAKDYVGSSELQEEFKDLVGKNKVIAVGECGLDYHYTHSSKENQFEMLEMQLTLASKNNLPLIFHVREAFNDFWPILDNYKNIRGVLHSYTDNEANLAEGLKRGLYFGVNGIATFTKNQQQIDVYKQIPLEFLLLETDSPFLTPAPYRGNINQPSKVETIAKFMADLRHEGLSTLAATTTANAAKLFGI